MPKHTPHSERINAAAGIMKIHPTLTAAIAMQLAGFSEEDYSKYNNQPCDGDSDEGGGRRRG
jgi:hypothetical protein